MSKMTLHYADHLSSASVHTEDITECRSNVAYTSTIGAGLVIEDKLIVPLNFGTHF